MTAGTRFAPRPSRTDPPPVDRSVNRLHSLVGHNVRVRGMRPGYPTYRLGDPEPADEVQDISGRIVGVRQLETALVQVGFESTGYVTYRIDSLSIRPAVGATR